MSAINAKVPQSAKCKVTGLLSSSCVNPESCDDTSRLFYTNLEGRSLVIKMTGLKLCVIVIFNIFTGMQFGTKYDKLKFDDGVKICKEASGEIAMPANAEENAALMKLVKPSEAAYLGLNDRLTEGRFEDVSGNRVTFTNWNSGEPNNYKGNEDYGTWNDLWCKWSRAIICQFKLI
uniref:Mannose-binding protein A-like n=1 Tax=Erpetoichthys calabaricus TaxID=27687 RepID=A0A8C4RQ57_ERPCA